MSRCICAKNLFNPAAAGASSEQRSEGKYDDNSHHEQAGPHLAETGMSICNRNRIMTGVRFLFRVTLRRLDLAAEIYHLREPQNIPLVMSPDETKRLLR